MAKVLKFSFIPLVVLLSCSQPKKENLIIGTWLYHHTENGGKSSYSVADSLKEISKNEGGVITFYNDKIATFTNDIFKGTEMQNRIYDFINDGNILVIKESAEDEHPAKRNVTITSTKLCVYGGEDSLITVFKKQ